MLGWGELVCGPGLVGVCRDHQPGGVGGWVSSGHQDVSQRVGMCVYGSRIFSFWLFLQHPFIWSVVNFGT